MQHFTISKKYTYFLRSSEISNNQQYTHTSTAYIELQNPCNIQKKVLRKGEVNNFLLISVICICSIITLTKNISD